MTESTELAIVSGNSVRAEIANLSRGQLDIFHTLTGDDFNTRATLLEALSNSVPVADNLDKTIRIVNVVAEGVEMVNEQTGELETQPRVVLIDEKGTAYHAISAPFFRDTKRILAIMGHPQTWQAPLPVHFRKDGTGTRKYFVIKLGEAPKK